MAAAAQTAAQTAAAEATADKRMSSRQGLTNDGIKIANDEGIAVVQLFIKEVVGQVHQKVLKNATFWQRLTPRHMLMFFVLSDKETEAEAENCKLAWTTAIRAIGNCRQKNQCCHTHFRILLTPSRHYLVVIAPPLRSSNQFSVKSPI